MKVLFANYRYFVSSGPERYMFNLTNLLTARGHEVIPFSINYTRNNSTPYAQYFVEPLGDRDQVYFQQHSFTPKTITRTISRLFYASDVEQAVMSLSEDTKPDIAYVLHYLRKLSPSILVGLKKANLPIVVRLSDFAMLCPQSHCLRDEKPCQLCVGGNLLPSIRYRCVQDSFMASSLNAIATWYHRYQKYFDLIDIFVTTNKFMYDMMLSAGVSESRLRCIPTFVDSDVFAPSINFIKDKYITYIGRLVPIKGVHILLDAMAFLHKKRPDLYLKLKVVGTGDDEYVSMLKKKVEELDIVEEIEFIGEMNASEISNLLSRSRISVVPSLWYENLPNSLLESYACGTPVIGSNTGTLSECILNGETGYLFKPGDAVDLAKQLEYCLDNPDKMADMSYKSYMAARDIYSSDTHISSLEGLFHDLIKK